MPPAATDRRLPPLEALAVVVLCFGLFIARSIQTVLQGYKPTYEGRFDDALLLGIVATEGVLAAAALGFLAWRRHPLRELLPRPDLRGSLLGVLLFLATVLANSIVQPALFDAADFARQPIVAMTAERPATLPVVLLASALNGLYEEAFLAGCLMRGLRAAGASLAIGVPLLVRVLYHLYQGPMGAVSVLVYGLVVGGFYWRTGRLWPVVVAHAVTDVVGLAG